MCPSGQASIRTGCTPDQESGSPWEEDRWEKTLLLEGLKQRFVSEPSCRGSDLALGRSIWCDSMTRPGSSAGLVTGHMPPFYCASRSQGLA
jgi:hypothetical protein